ncbi:tetratricopeptide repeat protein [Pedobacter sp. SAFR-022]
MFKSILLTLLCFLCLDAAYAQNSSKTDSLYQAALHCYEQQDKAQAMQLFQQVLQFNPLHKDALFNFGVVNYELGNQNKAFEIFQQGVKLHDRNAAELLKELGQPIAYADTMYLDDVDTLPKVLTSKGPEDLFRSAGALSFVLQDQIAKEIMQSTEIQKRLGKSRKLFVTLMFLDNGRLTGDVILSNEGQGQHVNMVFEGIQLLPAKYQGKAVSVWGLNVPISLNKD